MRFNWFPQTRRVFSMLSPLSRPAINYTPSPSSTFSSTNYLFKPENNLFYQHFSIIYLLIFHKLYLLFSRWPNVSRSQWTSVSRNNRNFNRKTPFWWKFGVFFVTKKLYFLFSLLNLSNSFSFSLLTLERKCTPFSGCQQGWRGEMLLKVQSSPLNVEPLRGQVRSEFGDGRS